jgi:hypothetical protein
MLAPHHGKDAELDEVGLAIEQAFDAAPRQKIRTAARRATPGASAPRAASEPELAGALTAEERAHFLSPAMTGPATYAPVRPGAEDAPATLGRHLDVRA